VINTAAPGPVAVVAPSLRMGGAERVAAEQARRFAEDRPTTLLTIEGCEHDFFAPPANVRRLSVPAGASRPRALHFLRMELRGAALVVAHVDHVALWVLTALLLQAHRPPVVVVEHADPSRTPIQRSRRLARRLLYRRAAEIVVLTKSSQAWFLESLGMQTTVIPNSVGGSAGHACTERSIDVVSVGRLSHEKGVDLLLEALADPVLREHELNVVIVGDGQLREVLEGQARKLGLDVEFVGAMPDPDSVLRRSKVFALPSRSEGHPLALLEAMASGCVPVAFDCEGGPHDIVTDGADGLLVPPENSAAFASHIDELLRDEPRRTEMSARAVESVRRFDPAVVDQKWDQVLTRHLD
jgi:glycosyltransferase involved in cell wall biosynthesis